MVITRHLLAASVLAGALATVWAWWAGQGGRGALGRQPNLVSESLREAVTEHCRTLARFRDCVEGNFHLPPPGFLHESLGLLRARELEAVAGWLELRCLDDTAFLETLAASDAVVIADDHRDILSHEAAYELLRWMQGAPETRFRVLITEVLSVDAHGARGFAPAEGASTWGESDLTEELSRAWPYPVAAHVVGLLMTQETGARVVGVNGPTLAPVGVKGQRDEDRVPSEVMPYAEWVSDTRARIEEMNDRVERLVQAVAREYGGGARSVIWCGIGHLLGKGGLIERLQGRGHRPIVVLPSLRVMEEKLCETGRLELIWGWVEVLPGVFRSPILARRHLRSVR